MKSPAGMGLLQSGEDAFAPINFATYFPGASQVVQTDIGLTYTVTLRGAASNTSATIISIGGSIAQAVPVQVRATNTLGVGSGAAFNVSFDGGATFPIAGLTPAIGTPIALTGAGAGLTLSWSAGTSVATDTWVATCASIADQSGSGFPMLASGTSSQPMELSPGPNGFPVIETRLGLNTGIVSGLLRPSPTGSSPTFLWTLVRITAAPIGNSLVYGGSDLRLAIYCDPGKQVGQYAGGALNPTVPASAGGAFGRIEAWFNAAPTDYIKFASVKQIGPASSGAVSNAIIGISNGFPCPMQFLAGAALPYLPSPAQLAAVDAAVTTKYLGAVGV